MLRWEAPLIVADSQAAALSCPCLVCEDPTSVLVVLSCCLSLQIEADAASLLRSRAHTELLEVCCGRTGAGVVANRVAGARRYNVGRDDGSWRRLLIDSARFAVTI